MFSPFFVDEACVYIAKRHREPHDGVVLIYRPAMMSYPSDEREERGPVFSIILFVYLRRVNIE